MMKWLFLAVFLTFGIVSMAPIADACDERYLLKRMLVEQQLAWNEGNIDGFMQAYWKSPHLRFASGGKVTRGWYETLKGYHERYPDRAAMGKLSFDVLEIMMFGDDDATMFGRWTLTRANDKPGGLFTLMFKRFDGDWKIVSDHTSSN